MRFQAKWIVLLAGVFVAVSVLWLASPPRATAGQPTGGFTLNPPNTAEDGSGDTFRVAGSGVFDAVGETVQASGAFTHFTAAGAVFAKGTWEATDFVAFDSFGGPSPGIQGGVLELEVTLFPSGGDPVPNVPMVITCCVFAPGACDEGTTVDDFTENTQGFTVFHVIP